MVSVLKEQVGRAVVEAIVRGNTPHILVLLTNWYDAGKMARVVGQASSGQEEHLLVKWKKTISSAQFWMQTGYLYSWDAGVCCATILVQCIGFRF